jgi:hypothetical protein
MTALQWLLRKLALAAAARIALCSENERDYHGSGIGRDCT